MLAVLVVHVVAAVVAQHSYKVKLAIKADVGLNQHRLFIFW